MADIKVSDMSPILASDATFTYAIDDVGGYGKLAINAANGLPILDANALLIPTADGARTLGSDAFRWAGLNLKQNSGQILWNDGTGSGDIIGYTSTIGPYFFDGTTTFALRYNIQALTVDRTITWPDAPGTVTLLGDQMINNTALSIAAGVVNIDCALGDYFTLALSANVTSITFSNLPASGKARTLMVKITQNAAAAKTVAFPSSFKWAGGVVGVVSIGLSAVDLVAFSSFDQGTTWQASIGNAYA